MNETKTEETSADEADRRRRKPRLVLRLNTGVGQSGRAFDAEIMNLSHSGMLVKTQATLAFDAPLEVVLPKVGPTVAKVVWFDDQLYGCSFSTPLTPEQLDAANEAASDPDETHGVDHATLGARIRHLRNRRGMTMRGLAAAVGVSKPTLWKWESDQVRPRHKTMQRLADELGVSELELVYGTPDLGEPEEIGQGSLAEIVRDAKKRIAEAAGVDEAKVDVSIDWGDGG